MDEYIKKSEAIKAIRENPSKMAMYTAKAICAIENLPTADVVPKSELEQLKRNLEQCENGYSQELHLARCQLADAKTEVEKLQKELEIWKQNRFNLFQRLGCYEMAKQKIASEIFEEIESKKMFLKDCVGNMGVVVLFKDISELKDKYAEGKQ